MDWDTPPSQFSKRENKPVAEKSTKSAVSEANLIVNKQLSTKTILVLLGLVSVIITVILVIRPAIIGYSVYKQVDDGNISVSELGASVQELRTQLASTRANLSLYTQVYDQVWKEVKTTTGDLTSCLAEKESLSIQVETLKNEADNDLTDCKTQLDTASAAVSQQLADKDKEIVAAKTERDKLEQNLALFVANIARSVCCKAKVDNLRINSYEVSNNRLVCLEDGVNALNC